MAKFISYRRAVLKELKARKKLALSKIGAIIEALAKLKTPVDTGTLRRSITHKVKGDKVYIGTNVLYAIFVELGTSMVKARSFLKSAMEEVSKDIQKIVEECYRGL